MAVVGKPFVLGMHASGKMGAIQYVETMHRMLTLASVCLAALAVEAHSAAPTLQVRAYALAAAARTRCAACVRMGTKSGGALT